VTTPPARLRVLISDDDPMIRDALRDVLQAEPDLEVVAVAVNADEAIELTRAHAPAVAVLDVRMPGGGGERAAQEIHRLSPTTRIMAFSAYGDTGALDEMRRLGVTEYVRKGVPNAEIVAAVRRLGGTAGSAG
jgi:DNA-binding NarL/FixJ family response regulator